MKARSATPKPPQEIDPSERITTTNIFVDKIYEYKYDPTPCNFFKRRKKKKAIKRFCKSIEESSPTFDMLWQMANFVKLADVIFFKGNANDSPLYSSNTYESGMNGFVVKDDEVSLYIKLVRQYKNTKIEIRRAASHNTTVLEFMNNDWVEEHSDYDEILLENIICIINRKVLELFQECSGFEYYKKLRNIDL